MNLNCAQKLSLVSSKGGVGKSTWAINGACALADMGLNVLCIDLDPQQSLSKFFCTPDELRQGSGLVDITALRLGASRRMLHELLGLSEAEYNRLKTMAGVPKAERNRPQSLSLDMQDMLATIHNNLFNCYRRQGSEPHPLQLLIRMAEATNLELNRVYDGYYCKNYAVFSGEKDGDSKEAGVE